MAPLLRILCTLLLGLLLAAAPAPAFGGESDGAEPQEVTRPDAPAVSAAVRHVARPRAIVPLPLLTVRPPADRSDNEPVRTHARHCVWRE
ncbi:hypothetical protein [Gemmata obscuriglobus]|nr:hypothetical protein [Gemmata obscuriglobus]